MVVRARRPSSDDGTTYRVEQTPRAAAITGLQALGEVPLVQVGRDDAIEVMGRRDVTVLIDGLRVTEPLALLKSLRADQIRSFEVVTGPTSRYPSQGGGGIVNVVLRRERKAARSFGASLGAATSGQIEASVSPSASGSGWSVAGTISSLANDLDTRSRSFQSFVGAEEGPLRRRDESKRSSLSSRIVSGTLTGSYSPSRRDRLTGLLSTGYSTSQRRSTSDASSGDTLLEASGSGHRYADATLSHTHEQEGLVAKSSLTYGLSTASSDIQLVAPERSFDLVGLQSSETAGASADLERRFGKLLRLRLGAELRRVAESRAQTTRQGSGPLLPKTFALESETREWNAYGDVQLRRSKLTLLAGVRAERRDFEAPGLLDRGGRFEIAPNVHAELSQGRGSLRLSYGQAVRWPSAADLVPIERSAEPRTAFVGNASLKPERTSTVELRYETQERSDRFTVVLARRHVEDPFVVLGTLVGDTVRFTPDNACCSEILQASTSAETKLGSKLSQRVDANLRTTVRDLPISRLRPFRGHLAVSGSYRLTFREKAEGSTGADRIDLRADYRGSSDDGLVYAPPSLGLTLDWTHSFSRGLTLFASLNGLDLLPRGYTRFRLGNAETGSFDLANGAAVKVSILRNW